MPARRGKFRPVTQPIRRRQVPFGVTTTTLTKDGGAATVPSGGGTKSVTTVTPQSIHVPSTSVLDSFTRADENPLSDAGQWTGPFNSDDAMGKIVSNRLVSTSSGGAFWCSAFWNPLTFAIGATQVEAWIEMPTLLGASDHLFVSCCIQFPAGYSPTAAISGYTLHLVGNGNWSITRWDNGTSTTIASGTTTLTAGDGVGIVAAADGNVGAYQKTAGIWGSLGSVADHAYASGNIGFEFNNNNIQLANFGGGVGTVVASTPSLIIPRHAERGLQMR